MEEDDDYATAMIEGRLRTVKEMRRHGSGMIQVEKLEAAIESLERSQAMLFEALEPQKGPYDDPRNSFGINPDKIQEYLSDVMNELEILQAQHAALYAELPQRRSPTLTVDPPFPSTPVNYGDSTLKFLEGSNLQVLLARSKHWNAAYPRDAPNPTSIYRIYFSQMIVTWNEAREQMKRMFWSAPGWRVEIAYLSYHYHCSNDLDTTKSWEPFRDWLLQCLNMAVTPSCYPTILASISHMGTHTIEDVKVPFDPCTEALLMNLLWMSHPPSVMVFDPPKLRAHYDLHIPRLQKLAASEDPQ